MSAERRTSDRRVSPAVGELAIQECARLRAVNAEMLHALEMVRDANRDEPHIPQPALDCINAAITKAEQK